MNTALGSQPKATFSTQPTVSPGQLGTLPDLYSMLINTFGTTATGAAPIAGQAQAAYGGQVGYQSPTVSAPLIDPTQAIQRGVVEPITQDFLQQTLPSIAGQFGTSAGGAFGSGSAQARGTAATQAERTIGQQAARTELSADELNQQAVLQALIANMQGSNQAAQIRNAALGLAPTVGGAYGAATQPSLQDLLTLALSPTQTTTGIGTGGSTGLIQGLLGGGVGQGVGSASGLALASALGLI